MKNNNVKIAVLGIICLFNVFETRAQIKQEPIELERPQRKCEKISETKHTTRVKFISKQTNVKRCEDITDADSNWGVINNTTIIYVNDGDTIIIGDVDRLREIEDKIHNGFMGKVRIPKAIKDAVDALNSADKICTYRARRVGRPKKTLKISKVTVKKVDGFCLITLIMSYEFEYTYAIYKCCPKKKVVDGNKPKAKKQIIRRSATSEIITIENTEIEPLKLYPNPSENVVHLKGGQLSKNEPYSIYDASGKLIKSGQLEMRAIDLSGIEAGFYLLHIENQILKLSKN